MANGRNSRKPARFANYVAPITPDPETLGKLAAKLGGLPGLCAKIIKFMTVRERETGWRVVQDVASRDRFHMSESEKKTEDREELPVPIPAMTAFLAQSAGEEELQREAVIAALAALANTPEAAKAGLSIRPTINEYVDRPYATVSIAKRGGTGVTQEQMDMFEE